MAKDHDDLAAVDPQADGRAAMKANARRKALRAPSPKRKGVSGSPEGPNLNRGIRFDPKKGVRVHNRTGREWPICGDPRGDKGDGWGCRQFAGGGTGHPGYGKCRSHGGTAETHELKWAKVMAEEELAAMQVTFGGPIEVAPAQALLWCVHITAGHVAWLHARIGEIPEDELMETQSRALLAIYNGERDRLARFSKMATDAGANEALVRFTAANANAIIGVCQEALGAIPNLSKDQVEDFFKAVALGLGELEGMSPDEVTSRFAPKTILLDSPVKSDPRSRKSKRDRRPDIPVGRVVSHN
jgi:hypothetical protein